MLPPPSPPYQPRPLVWPAAPVRVDSALYSEWYCDLWVFMNGHVLSHMYILSKVTKTLCLNDAKYCESLNLFIIAVELKAWMKYFLRKKHAIAAIDFELWIPYRITILNATNVPQFFLSSWTWVHNLSSKCPVLSPIFEIGSKSSQGVNWWFVRKAHIAIQMCDGSVIFYTNFLMHCKVLIQRRYVEKLLLL